MQRNMDEQSSSYPTTARSPAATSRTATRRRVGGPRVVIQLPDVSLVNSSSTETLNERVSEHASLERAPVERVLEKRSHEVPLPRAAASLSTLVNQSPLDAIAEFSPPMPSPITVEPIAKPTPFPFNPLLNRFHVAAWLSQPRVLLSGVVAVLLICGTMLIVNNGSTPEVAEDTDSGIGITLPTTVAQQPATQLPALGHADDNSEAPRFVASNSTVDRWQHQPPKTAQLPPRATSRDFAADHRHDDRDHFATEAPPTGADLSHAVPSCRVRLC